MAKLSLPFRGTGIDYSRLTAIEKWVRKGKKFIGKDSNDIRIGDMEQINGVNKQMGINEMYVIPEGEHTGTTVYQEIVTMVETEVYPGGGEVVIPCAGKYMTGNIVIRATANLKPENIKWGVVVGEGEGAITGTCQGFFD